MFDGVLEIIKKAGIFLILAQTVLHLCVGDSYEKYIKMIVGLITAMMLILPVMELFREGGFQDFESYRLEYEAQMMDGSPDFENIKDDAWDDYFEEGTGGEF